MDDYEALVLILFASMAGSFGLIFLLSCCIYFCMKVKQPVSTDNVSDSFSDDDSI